MKKGILLLLLCVSIETMAQYAFYKRGVEAYQGGKYEEAVREMTSFLAKHTRQKNLDQDAHYVRALAFYKMKNYPDAIKDFDASVNLGHPNKGNIFWFKGKCYEAQHFPAKAIAEYSEALKILTDPHDEVAILLDRSRQYKALSDEQNALNDLNKGLSIAPGNEALKEELALYQAASASALALQATGPVDLERLRQMYQYEQRYALVIGNSNYKNVAPLRNPAHDAASISASLKKLNFDVIDVTDATYMEIRTAFFKFHEKLVKGPVDQTIGLFFYAGHGLQNDGENYLVPVDAHIEFEDDIPRQCFPVQKIILSNMERTNSRMNIIILDACRNNPFPGTARNSGAGLAEMKKAKGSFIAYATAPGSVASDGVGKNGLYTQELLKALDKPGLSLEQVFKEVRMNVLRLSNEKQNTWDASNITGDFHFNIN